ncbi:hypothetical protein HanRHA438_Chr16g0746981 [Helianthus annuus]|nr:hypothetical protein HanRHA438_Chr16g0746981 [Helianthus annuus]
MPEPSKSYLYLLGGIRLGLNLYLAQVNTFNLFSLIRAWGTVYKIPLGRAIDLNSLVVGYYQCDPFENVVLFV